MNAPLDIRHLVPAGSIKQRWLDNLLGPAIKACRFSIASLQRVRWGLG